MKKYWLLIFFLYFYAANAQGQDLFELATYYHSASDIFKLNKEIDSLSSKIVLEPTAQRYTFRGNNYLATGKYNLAIEDFTRAMQLYKDGEYPYSRSSLYIKKALAYVLRGDVSASLKMLDAAYALQAKAANNYEMSETNYLRAMINSFCGNYKEVIDLLKLSRSQLSGDKILYQLGTQSLILNDNLVAKDYFNRAKISFDTSNEMFKAINKREIKDFYGSDHANFIFANQKILERDYLGAIRMVKNNFSKKFNTLDPLKVHMVSSYVLLGRLYEKVDSLPAALDCYQKVVAISPLHRFANDKISSIQSRLAEKGKNDITPPVVLLYAPAATERSQIVKADKNKKMLVKGRVMDASPIDWIKVNGKVLGITEILNGFFEIQIDPVNKLEIQARDIKGNTSKVYSYEVTIEAPAPSVRPGPARENYYALFIACSAYEGKWFPLSTTIDEARGFSRILGSKYGFNTDTLFNANRIRIMEGIGRFINEHNGANDNLVIFFAGHGSMERLNNEPTGYLIPLFAQKTEDYISRNDVAILLNRSTAKHILFITDACLSEFMRGDPEADSMAAVNSNDFNLPSRQLLTSSGTKNAAGQSVLVPTAIELLEKNTEPYLSVIDLYGQIFKRMATVKESRPELPLPTIGPMRIEGDKLGSFYFKRL